MRSVQKISTQAGYRYLTMFLFWILFISIYFKNPPCQDKITHMNMIRMAFDPIDESGKKKNLSSCNTHRVPTKHQYLNMIKILIPR